MRITFLLIALSTIVLNAKAQNFYFLSGGSFSSYQFKSSAPMTSSLESGSGNFYDLGIAKQLQTDKLFYNIGLNLNEYNAYARSSANNYSWQTKFIGIQNALEYRASILENLLVSWHAGFNLSTILYGQQAINGQLYNLRKEEEFSGIKLEPFTKLQLGYQFNNIGYISLGYSIGKSYFLNNETTERLSITNQQIIFGLHFNIK